MSFYPDPSKQAQEVMVSRKTKKEYHPSLAFKNNNVSETNSQKHLGSVLDHCLSFEGYLKMILNKVNKTIELQNILPRSALLTIYKTCIRPHFHYDDIIYDQASKVSFHQKLELLQYNACLVITGAIRGTSKEKLYKELGLESLQLCHWCRKLSCFYKLFNSEHPHYLFKLISSGSSGYVTRNMHNISFFKTRHTFLKNSFFLSTIIEWNKLDQNMRNSSSFNIFRKSILKFVRSSANSFFNSHNPKGIKCITRLWLGLSHLWEHKFKYSCQDYLNLFCNSVIVVWTLNQLCSIFFTVPHILLNLF